VRVLGDPCEHLEASGVLPRVVSRTRFAHEGLELLLALAALRDVVLSCRKLSAA